MIGDNPNGQLNDTQRRINELRAEWDKAFGDLEEDRYWQLWFTQFPKAFFLAPGNRLTAAFEELSRRGYFAEQNFYDCDNCARAAIPDNQFDRHVFYHGQGFESLLETGEVYLYWYGDGDEIVFVLKRHGLTVEWNGDPNRTILVKDLFEPRALPGHQGGLQ